MISDNKDSNASSSGSEFSVIVKDFPSSELSDKSKSESEPASQEENGSSYVHSALIMGLDFSHGINFAKDVKIKFGSSVHPSRSSGNFTMVVSFGRSSFKLVEDNVGIALEAVVGGYCGEIKVSLIRDRVFSFCVANKSVGFHVAKLRSYSCAQFKCFFHLWGRGGPNWQHEFALWNQESEAEWTLVSPSKKRTQMGLNALKKKAAKSIIKSAHEYLKKFNFAETLSYSACLGYNNPKQTGKDQAGICSSSITLSRPDQNSNTWAQFQVL
jgi:hypothetical protein